MELVELGSRIRQARERLGKSQYDLAEAVNKDQRAISEYEAGKRKLPAIDLPLFARALQVPLLYFYEGEIELADLDHQFLTEFQQLPTADAKNAAIEIVRILSKTVNNTLHLR